MSSNPFETIESRLDTIDEKLGLILNQKGEGPIQHKKRYYTRAQTCAELYITLPTLHLYTKKGLIQCSRIGTRILYTDEAIAEAIKTIPTLSGKGR